jgi:hypothetical protein
MASFTDAISQFNPYVQQLPVELMGKVGMQKQAQYDQGVQKIQQSIDNVAGLDVAHDSDKTYLHSKLGELGNRLKTVAAGDFSNQQLVNSVGGMTSQVIKDKNIENAVASTAWYKKQKEELDKAYKDGKSSVANVDDFNTQAEKWLSTDKVGQVFRGRYSPYIDIEKHNLEVFKVLHASETGKDFVNERYTDRITGKLLDTNKLAVAMEREGVEGISAKKIETALRASYTPDILNQMRINANFDFKGVTSEQLSERADKQYKNSLQRTDEEIERLEGIAAMSGAQPVLQKRALDSIQDLIESKAKLDENYKQQVENIFANPDRAKFEIYKEGAIDQFANSFSWEKRTTQVLNNPQWQGEREADRLAIQKAEHYLNVRKQSFYEYDQNRQDAFNEKKFAAENGPMVPFMTALGEATKNLPAPLTAIAQSTVGAGQEIEKNIGVLLNAYPELKGNRAELQKRLIGFQNGDKSQFSADMQDTAQAIIDARKKVRENAAIENVARAEVESDPKVAAIKKQLTNEVSKIPPIKITLRNGKVVNLSGREQFDLILKSGNIMAGGPSEAAGSKASVDATSNLTPQELEILKVVYPAQIANKNGVGEAVTKYSKFVNDVDNRVNGLLSTKVGKFAPLVENLDATEAKKRLGLESIAGSVLMRYDSGVPGLSSPGGDVFMSDGDRDKAKGWMAGEGKGDLQYKTVKMGDNNYLAIMKGTETVMMKLTGMEASHPLLQSGTDKYGRYVLEKQEAFRGSTNFSGKPEDAEYGMNFFTNVKKYPVVADLKYNPQNPAVNHITLQVKLRNGWQPIQLDPKVDASQARAFLSTLTDADVEKALKSKGISIK